LTFAIQFKEDAIRSIQRDYIQVKCNPLQLLLIKKISKAICEQIDVPILVIRAATWYALKEWQLKYNKTISELNSSDIKSKIIAGKEIFDIEKHTLKQFLKEPKIENEMKLDIVYEKAFKIYLKIINQMND
jgi:hypothetical protein